MEEQQNSNRKTNQPDDLPPLLKGGDTTNPPSNQTISSKTFAYTKKSVRNFIHTPIGWTVKWLDHHDGLVTAVATAAIALLTYFLAKDSARLANISNDEAVSLKGQLVEIRAARVDSDTHFNDQLEILREQVAVLHGQLDAMGKAQRAFVNIRDPALESVFQPDSERHILHFIWENSGETPTRNLTIELSCLRTDGQIPAEFKFPEGSLTSKVLLPPKGVMTQGVCAITRDDMVAFAHRVKTFTIIARARYGDIIDNRPMHVTEYCSVLRGFNGNPLEGLSPGQSISRPMGISLEACRTHNCADEECN